MNHNPVISFFDSATANVPSNHISIADVFELIRKPEPNVVALIKRIRAIADKDERNALKRNLPAVTYAADLHHRRGGTPLEDKLIALSGYCCMDFDHDENSESLENPESKRDDLMLDPYVAAAFVSPSGNGLKVVVRFDDPERHADCWCAAADWFQEKHGLTADTACKNVTWLHYLSHDPDIYVAKDGEVEAFDPAGDESRSERKEYSGGLIEEGSRNSTLASLAGSMRRRGMSEEAIRAALIVTNRNEGKPPLSEDEVAGIARSVARYDPEDVGTLQNWPELVDFGKSEPPPSLNLGECIPNKLHLFRDFIAQTANELQVPVEMVAPLAVSLASLGCARALEVEIKPGWIETAPVWACVLAESGELKSPLLARLREPIDNWQAIEKMVLDTALKQHAERRRILGARINGLRNTLEKPLKATQDPIPQDVIEKQTNEFVEQLNALPELHLPVLTTGDATPEAVRDLLGRNGEKLGVVCAEGAQIEVIMGRYSEAGPNLDLFLSGHCGDPYAAHRVGKDILPLKRPALVCCLAIQPVVVRTLMRSPDAVERGLVPRFLFIKPQTFLGNCQ